MSICRLATKCVDELFLRQIVYPSICVFRNAYIVKRRYPPRQSKLNAPTPRTLRPKNYIYETVEDTDLTNPPDLHIVLTTFVDGIGDVGDVISVCPFYARDHLLLPKKAVYATPENIEKYDYFKKNRQERPKFSSIHAGMVMKILSKITIPVFMNFKVPWTLERSHIHIAFRTEDFYVPEEAIELPTTPIEGPDSLKEARDFACFVTINNTERVPVRCRLYYLKDGFETAKRTEDLYLDKNEPILAEQAELLESMPMPEIVNDPSSSVSLIEKYRIQYIK